MAFDLGLAAVPELRPKEFAQIRDFAFETFGLDLRQGKERLVSARLGKHLAAGGFRSFEAYFRHVKQDTSGQSLLALIDALTTNHTAFLREAEHFKFLTSTVLPGLGARQSLTIWSAASSTGEEVYTLLFSLLEAQQRPRGMSVRILGTDISTKVLNLAREGVYTREKIDPLGPTWQSKYFDRPEPGKFRVRPEFRSMTEFRRLNLMEPLPHSFHFPAIFCRNVMIYFNKKTQADLVRRLAGALEPGGYLFVGHAESLTGIEHNLRYVRPAVYQKAS